jgi:hypothetical protein
MDKMTLKQAKELADLWRQIDDMRSAQGRCTPGTSMSRAYSQALWLLTERKETLIDEITNG